MSVLTRCDGPECPNCGCQDVQIITEPKASNGQVSWWGSGRSRCNHCRQVFSFREVPKPAVVEEVAAVGEIVFPGEPKAKQEDTAVQTMEVERKVVVVPKCPDCGGETKVSSTRKGFRWHKCVKCGKTMKTAR